MESLNNTETTVIRCTNLEFFQQCPVRYFLVKEGIFKSFDSPAIRRGKALHKILEYVTLKKENEIAQYIKQYEDLQHFLLFSLNEFIQFLNKKIIKIHLTETRLQIQKQTPFGIVHLHGQPDLIADVDIDGEIKPTLIDFKTSTNLNETAIYSFQLLFYSLLAPIKIERGIILNFLDTKVPKYKIFKKDFNTYDYLWLESLINYCVATEKRGIYIKSWNNCNWCDSREECKALPTVVDLSNLNILNTIKTLKETMKNEQQQQRNPDFNLFK